MFNSKYSKIGIITTGVLSIGTALYYYYYGGNTPFSKETQLTEEDN
jgi:hypothetical protein